MEGPPSREPDRNQLSEESQRVIGAATSIEAIIEELGKRGCPDLTRSLKLSACSQFPVAGGGFCDVYSGALHDGTKIAIKSLRVYEDVYGDSNRKKILKHAARELYHWSRLRHPNVLPLMGLALFQNRISMISGWVDNGDLRSFLLRHPSTNRLCLCVDVCAGLQYIHKDEMVHGDLKAANVMVSSGGVAMITDFGNANLKDITLQFTNTGKSGISLRWAAPEMLQDDARPSKEADVYAYGMTALEIITGKIPYEEMNDAKVMMMLAEKTLTPSRPKPSIGDNLWDILKSCWAQESGHRPTMREVMGRLLTLKSVDDLCTSTYEHNHEAQITKIDTRAVVLKLETRDSGAASNIGELNEIAALKQELSRLREQLNRSNGQNSPSDGGHHTGSKQVQNTDSRTTLALRKTLDKLSRFMNGPKDSHSGRPPSVSEGEYANRFQTNASESGAHHSFVPIMFDGTKYIINAGVAQGITPNSRFGIHKTNIPGFDNPRIGTCLADIRPGEQWISVCSLNDTEQDWLDQLRLTMELLEPNTSLLQPPVALGMRPPVSRGTIDFIEARPLVIAFAQLFESRPTLTLDVYLTGAFKNAFQGNTNRFVSVRQTKPKVQIKGEVPSKDEANTVLGIDIQNAEVTFTLTGKEEKSSHRPRLLPHTVPTLSDQVQAVLFSMQQWRWHSLRTPPDHNRPFSENLQIELYRLETDNYDGSLLPVGDSLNVGGEVTIFASPKVFYGFKVVNPTPRLLFAYPFYFSTASQSIRPLFLRVYGGDEAEARTDENLEVLMEYDGDGYLPISFQPTNAADISEGVLDVGIVRFFITTSHADFESVSQPSPFAAPEWVKPGDEFADGVCFAREEQAKAILGGQNVRADALLLFPAVSGFLARDRDMTWDPEVEQWDVVDMKIIILSDS